MEGNQNDPINSVPPEENYEFMTQEELDAH